MIVDKLLEKIAERQNPTCVGLDTAYEYLPEGMRKATSAEGAAEEIFAFSQGPDRLL